MNFDVENFYPSISIDLFTDAISCANHKYSDQLSIILNSRKTLLFNNKEPRVKKTVEENFDALMGCYDSAEVCELVGTYILNKLKMLQTKGTLVSIVTMDLEYFKIYPKLK